MRLRIGINIGNHDIDQNLEDDRIFGLFKNIRYFKDMDKDYPVGKVPRNSKVDNPSKGWGRFKNDILRLTNLKRKHDVHITMTLQVISNGWKLNDWRAKFWTKEELGTTSIERVKNSYHYATEILKHYSGLVDVIELGNEPWSDKHLGYDALNDWVMGWMLADKDINHRIQLLPPAMRFGQEKYGSDNLDNIITTGFNTLNTHLYSFDNCVDDKFSLTAPPESLCSDLRHVYDVINCKALGYYKYGSVSVSETGFDSYTVGELTQAAFNVRSLLNFLDNSYVGSVYFYESVDDTKKGLYGSSGFLTNKDSNRVYGREKLVYKAFKTLLPIIRKSHHAELIKGAFKTTNIWNLYLYENKKPSYYITWVIDNMEGDVLKYEDITIDRKIEKVIPLAYMQDTRFTKRSVRISGMPLIIKLAPYS